ncbi:HlyD family secretion protein [Geminicoccus roseus]|uniref:HlyD family secretion protein n=1 Tax=Geminicoccus roseus TaxID=404900 RepID=UPI000404A715|nr:HlyD family secretion protein [Geminicoccus roseus]
MPSTTPDPVPPPGPEPAAALPAAPAPGGLRRLAVPVLAVLTVLILVGATNARFDSWVASSDVQTTDDASIDADTTRLSARVGGNVRRILVQDFQKVEQGQLLLEIDPGDYRAALAGAEATVRATQAGLANLGNQAELQGALVEQAQLEQAAAQAQEKLASQEAERQRRLVEGGIAGTRQRLEQATAAHQEAVASWKASAAAVRARRSQLAVLDGQKAVARAQLAADRAARDAARLRLGYTRITAPVSGVAGRFQVRVGDYVTAGTSLVSVVPLPRVYVTARYKETQLARVRPGQPAEIAVDSFPGQVLRGRVARLSPASGSVFALLPPDNATGNFTKVVQRIPVRIELEPDQPLLAALRPGMSVVASIRVDGSEAGRTEEGADGS